MIIYYVANGVSGQMGLPSAYIEQCTAVDLAELVASDYWRYRREQPSLVTLIHLQDVDGADLGMFEVRRDMRPVFTATAMIEHSKKTAPESSNSLTPTTNKGETHASETPKQ